jgi:hypothetical protein
MSMTTGACSRSLNRAYPSIFRRCSISTPQRRKVDNENQAVKNTDGGEGHRQETDGTCKCFFHCTCELKDTADGSVGKCINDSVELGSTRFYDRKNMEAVVNIFHSTMREGKGSWNDDGAEGCCPRNRAA